MNGKGEQIVGLKVCVKYEPEVILSMQRGTFTVLDHAHAHDIAYAEACASNTESKKMAFLEELQVCKYTAILEAGDDYAVKEWAEGITGVEWFKVWEMDGAKTNDESFRKLIQLFRKVGEKKIYLQNFKPHNLLWDQEQRLWQVGTPPPTTRTHNAHTHTHHTQMLIIGLRRTIGDRLWRA